MAKAKSPRECATGTEAKARVTFRLPADVVWALRRLPNQTAVVEQALREHLDKLCPLCHGTGRSPGGQLAISDFKHDALGRLDREAAQQLKALVRLGRELLATELRLELSSGTETGAVERDSDLSFRLARDQEMLLTGRISRDSARRLLLH